MTTLSQWLQCILLYIHQYKICAWYTPCPELYIAGWLSTQNHCESKDEKNFWHEPKHQHYRCLYSHSRMYVNTKNMRHNVRWWTLTSPKSIHNKWLVNDQSRGGTQKQPYWTFCDIPVVIVRITLKDRQIVYTGFPLEVSFEQLHCKHMGLEKNMFIGWLIHKLVRY